MLGQSDGIVGSASREASLPPEEVELRLVIAGGADFSLDNAVRLVGEFGITAQHVSGVWTGSNAGYSASGIQLPPPAPGEPPRQITYYSFLINSPYARLRELRERLASVEKKLPEGVYLQSEMSIRTTEKTLDAAKQRLWPELSAEARRRAEAFASAANVRLGAVRSVDEGYPGLGYGLLIGRTGLTESSLRYVFNVNIRFAIAP